MPAPASLTVVCVVRDEAESLRRALASVREIAAELLVVDTGSTDASPEIAASFGARVLHRAWDDDFSAPLNLALEQVRTPWALRLDADEAVVAPEPALFRLLLQRQDTLAYWVRREEVHDEAAEGGFVEMDLTRLWRADQGLRFQGRYHEQFWEQLPQTVAATGLQLRKSGVRLRHWGHRTVTKRPKLQRAARIMERELQDRPGQLYFEIELGRTWTALADPRGRPLLEHALSRVLQQAHNPQPPLQAVGPLLEHCLRAWSLSPAERERLEQLALRWYPASLPLLETVAGRRFEEGDFASAASLYGRMVRLAETNQYDRSTPFAPRLLGDEPLLYLAVCLHRLAQWEEAERAYLRLLHRYPEHPSGTANLSMLRQQRATMAEPAPRKVAATAPRRKRRS